MYSVSITLSSEFMEVNKNKSLVLELQRLLNKSVSKNSKKITYDGDLWGSFGDETDKEGCRQLYFTMKDGNAETIIHLIDKQLG